MSPFGTKILQIILHVRFQKRRKFCIVLVYPLIWPIKNRLNRSPRRLLLHCISACICFQFLKRDVSSLSLVLERLVVGTVSNCVSRKCASFGSSDVLGDILPSLFTLQCMYIQPLVLSGYILSKDAAYACTADHCGRYPVCYALGDAQLFCPTGYCLCSGMHDFNLHV